MPTRDTPWPNGTPCWVDYSAVDVDAAKEFYAAVLGWEYTGGGAEYGGYLTALRNGRQAAGLMPRMEESAPVAWTTYFATDDSDAAARRITEAGGTLIAPPMDVDPFGRMTVALDPQGYAFGLWEARQHTGAQVFNEPGAVTWNEAAVDDPEAARAFYAAVFGFRYTEVPGAGGYATFSTEERPLGGLGGAQPGTPKGWLTCFAVASADEAVAAVEAAGGKVIIAPMDTEFGRFAVVEDPWGAPFEVMQAPAA